MRLGNIVGLVLSTSLWRYGTIKLYTVVFDNYPFPRNIQLYKRKCCVQYKWRMVNTCLLSCLFIHSFRVFSKHFRQFGSYTFHVKNSNFLCSLCRYTDENLILATPGPCTVEVRDAASLSQKEFIERLIDI